MTKIAEIRKDINGQFPNVLYLEDVEGRAKVLAGFSQTSLTYLTPVTRGLQEKVEKIKE